MIDGSDMYGTNIMSMKFLDGDTFDMECDVWHAYDVLDLNLFLSKRFEAYHALDFT